MTAGAILFDKDGTLFGFQSSWGAWTRQMIETETRGDAALIARLEQVLGFDMAEGGFAQDSPIIAGTPQELVDLVQSVLPKDRHAGLLERLDASAAAAPMMPVCDLAPVLGALRDEGWRLGVVTNDSHAPSVVHLETANVLGYFDRVIGFDSGFGGKPGPGPCLACADALGVAPERAIMVGDSLTDMRAGRAAGMTCVAVTTGIATQAELAPYADVVLPSIAQLPQWVSGRG